MKKQARGESVPALDNEPVVPDCLHHIWNWFMELSNTRRRDFGEALAITRTEVALHLNEEGVYSPASRRSIWECIHALDVRYLNGDNKNG